MRRRDLIAMLGGGAMVWSCAVRAQRMAMPLIGWLDDLSPEDESRHVASFQDGMRETGYVEGRNLKIEYRWARSQLDRLPALCAELVKLRVDVLVAAGGTTPGQVARAATTVIPIVAMFGRDPIKTGLLTSLSHPGGNFTGVWVYITDLVAKRMGLLHELIPTATKIAWLANPTAPGFDEERTAVQAAAQNLGLQVIALEASSAADLNPAFEILANERPETLLVSSFPFFETIPIRERLFALAGRYAIPTGCIQREQAEAGALMSYSTSQASVYHTLGVYAGRVLRGEKPGDLPVQLPTKFELIINLRTAKSLGLTIPPTLLATADEVIE
jgi:putative ABC transport system substrate-binding protein